jgi:hypothetical protein
MGKNQTLMQRKIRHTKRHRQFATIMQTVNFRNCRVTEHAIDRYLERVSTNTTRHAALNTLRDAFKNAEYVGRVETENGAARVYRNGALIMRLAAEDLQNTIVTCWADYSQHPDCA